MKTNTPRFYSKPIAGIQTPILVGIGGLILGVVLMLASVMPAPNTKVSELLLFLMVTLLPALT